MEFNVPRVGLLLKRQFIGNGRKYITGIAIGTGVVLMIALASVLFGSGAQLSQFYQSGLITYIVGGIIMTSMTFAEINRPETGYQLMTLPASSLEKFASTWLFTSVVYSLMAFVVLTLGACLLYVLGLFDLPIEGEILSINEMWIAFKQYFIGNTIFLAGAAAFKRNAFFKTLLSIMVLSAFLALYSLALIKLYVLPSLATFDSTGGSISINGNNLEWLFGNLGNSKYFLSLLGSIFLLVVGFLKFREREM
jgi:hypothetical protein